MNMQTGVLLHKTSRGKGCELFAQRLVLGFNAILCEVSCKGERRRERW